MTVRGRGPRSHATPRPAGCRAASASPGVAVLLAGVSASGCEGPQVVLDPASDAAARIADLWWIMFSVTGVLSAAVLALLAHAIWRARRAAAEAGDEGRLPVGETTYLVAGGAVLPAAVLLTFAYLTVRVGSEVTTPLEPPAVRVDVVAHQFWWEVRYPELGIVTANEIHLPAGRTAEVNVTSADVIHSFWVPRLHGKIDMNPGRTNTLWLHPEEPGVYRGQCTEFCGVQHALMAFLLVAEPEDEFARWVAVQQRPAQLPVDAELRRGLDVFFEAGCADCHAIRGIHRPEFVGSPGPDLTHLATRRTLAAATLENNRGNLGGWLLDPQALKPGNRMPATVLSSADFTALLAYMESLR